MIITTEKIMALIWICSFYLTIWRFFAIPCAEGEEYSDFPFFIKYWIITGIFANLLTIIPFCCQGLSGLMSIGLLITAVYWGLTLLHIIIILSSLREDKQEKEQGGKLLRINPPVGRKL